MPKGNSLAERNREIVQLRAAGVAITELAQKFGISKQRIHQLLLQLDPQANSTGRGIRTYRAYLVALLERERRRAGRPRCRMKQATAEVLALRGLGLRQAAIAQLLGLRQQTVSTILIQQGKRSHPGRSRSPAARM